MIFTLAKETGWPERELLWEIPFARLLQYYHAALRSHDLWTVPPSSRKAPAMLEIREVVGQMKWQGMDDDEEV